MKKMILTAILAISMATAAPRTARANDTSWKIVGAATVVAGSVVCDALLQPHRRVYVRYGYYVAPQPQVIYVESASQPALCSPPVLLYPASSEIVVRRVIVVHRVRYGW